MPHNEQNEPKQDENPTVLTPFNTVENKSDAACGRFEDSLRCSRSFFVFHATGFFWIY